MIEELDVEATDRDELVSGDKVVRILQYEVREGREAGEVVVIPQAFIANCNSSFILQEVMGGDQAVRDSGGSGVSDGESA